MSRATDNLMDLLHGTVTQSLLDEIKKYKEKGEPIPASLLGQAIKFLKDNGIDRPVRKGDELDQLAGELPELDDEGNVVSLWNRS